MSVTGASELDQLEGMRVVPLLRIAVLAVAVVWALGVANLTLFPASGVGPRNPVPFRTIWEYVSDGHLPLGVRFRNLAGNVAMLLPLGLVLATVTRWRWNRVGVALLAVSASIELWQLVVAPGRSVDVDDVILNLAGGMVGWLAGLVLLGLLARAGPALLVRDDRIEIDALP